MDTPNQAFSILQPGSYRLEASEDGDSTLVTVREGEGEAFGDRDSYLIHSGQSTRFSGVDRLQVTDLRLGRVDDFDEWGLARDRAPGGVGLRAACLPRRRRLRGPGRVRNLAEPSELR